MQVNLTLCRKYQKWILWRMTGMGKQRMKIPGTLTGKVTVMETQNTSWWLSIKQWGYCSILLCRYSDKWLHGELQNTMAQWCRAREGRKQQRIANPTTRPKNDGKVCRPFFLKLGLQLKQTGCKGSGTSTSTHADWRKKGKNRSHTKDNSPLLHGSSAIDEKGEEVL